MLFSDLPVHIRIYRDGTGEVYQIINDWASAESYGYNYDAQICWEHLYHGTYEIENNQVMIKISGWRMDRYELKGNEADKLKQSMINDGTPAELFDRKGLSDDIQYMGHKIIYATIVGKNIVINQVDNYTCREELDTGDAAYTANNYVLTKVFDYDSKGNICKKTITYKNSDQIVYTYNTDGSYTQTDISGDEVVTSKFNTQDRLIEETTSKNKLTQTHMKREGEYTYITKYYYDDSNNLDYYTVEKYREDDFYAGLVCVITVEKYDKKDTLTERVYYNINLTGIPEKKEEFKDNEVYATTIYYYTDDSRYLYEIAKYTDGTVRKVSYFIANDNWTVTNEIRYEKITYPNGEVEEYELYNSRRLYYKKKYDANGNAVEGTYYNDDEKNTPWYKNCANITKRTYYDKTLSLKVEFIGGAYTFEEWYEESQNKKFFGDYKQDGSYVEITYYDNENLIPKEMKECNSDGDITYSYFDEDGNPLDYADHIIERNENGDITYEKWVYFDGTYESVKYNHSDGTVSSKEIHYPDGRSESIGYHDYANGIKSSYQNTDAQGNWTEERYCDDGKTVYYQWESKVNVVDGLNERILTIRNANGSYWTTKFVDGEFVYGEYYDSNNEKKYDDVWNYNNHYDSAYRLTSENLYFVNGGEVKVKYHKNGKMGYISEERADGTRTTIRYYESGEMESIVEKKSDGTKTSNEYYENHRIKLEKEYDSEGNVIKGIYRNDNEDNDPRYTGVDSCYINYYDNGNMSYESIDFINGAYKHISYDEDGLITRINEKNADGSSTDTNYIDYENNLIKNQTVTNADGSETVLRYNNDGKTIYEKVETNADGIVTETNYYDYENDKISSKKVTNTDGTYEYVSYNEDGLITRINEKNADGSSTDTNYIDYENNLIRSKTVTNADGSYTSTSYYESGNKKLEHKYDSEGNVIDGIYYYDDEDHKVKYTDVRYIYYYDYGATSSEYYVYGATSSELVTFISGSIKKVLYDENGAIIQTEENADGTYRKECYYSNGKLQKKEETKADGSSHILEYDEKEKLTREIISDDSGTTHYIEYYSDQTSKYHEWKVDGANNYLMSNYYNEDGSILYEDVVSVTTDYYDTGEINSIILNYIDGSCDRTYYYKSGNFEAIYKNAPNGDAISHVEYYDNADNTEHYVNIRNGDGTSKTIAYYEDHTIEYTYYSEEKADGTYTDWKYDGNGRPLSERIRYPDSSRFETFYLYDDENHIAKYEHTYASNGQMIESVSYYENGKERFHGKWNVDGEMIYGKEYYESGVLEFYHDGGYVTYTETGYYDVTPQAVYYYRKTDSNGNFVEANYYDEKGEVKYADAWGVLDIAHYESGKVCSEQVNYIDGSIGHFVYYEDGKLRSIGFDYSDGSHTYTSYYEDGETKEYDVTNADGSGTHTSYYEDGETKEYEKVIKADSSYTFTYYYEDGVRKRAEEVTNADGSGTFTSYYADGVKVSYVKIRNADGSYTQTYYYKSQNKMFEEKRDSDDNFISGIFYNDDEKNNERYKNVANCGASYDDDEKLYHVYVHFIDGSNAQIHYSYDEINVTAYFNLYNSEGTLIDSYTEINGVRQ